MIYQVVVGNMGVAYNGELEKEAKKTYDKYVEASNQGFGQVGHETVVLTCDGTIVSEFVWKKQ